jgi:hypothetical protein
MPTSRPDVSTSTFHDPLRLNAETERPRQMEWEIRGSTVTYTCSQCSWQLVVMVGTCPEPLRVFDKHTCISKRQTREGPD